MLGWLLNLGFAGSPGETDVSEFWIYQTVASQCHVPGVVAAEMN